MGSGDLVEVCVFQRGCEELITQVPRRSFQAQLFLCRVGLDVDAFADERQTIGRSQLAHEVLVRLRLNISELVIEVNDR